MLRCIFVSILLGTLYGCAAFKYDEREADSLYRHGQIGQAIEHYVYLAEFGLPSAQLKLGKVYLALQEYQKAEYWLLKAENSQPVKAKIALARLYAFSESPAYKKTDKAYAMLFELLQQGHTNVVNDLVKLYRRGDMEALPQQEMQLIAERAEDGDHASCYLMAKLYSEDLISEEGRGEANRHNQKMLSYFHCAQKSYPSALMELAALLNQRPELGSFEEVHTLINSMTDLVARDQLKIRMGKVIRADKLVLWRDDHAETLLIEASETTTEAHYQLAQLYLVKPVLGKNGTDIIKVLKEGQRKHCIECFALEAEMYLNGNKVTQDPWKAEKILKKLPEKHPYVAYLLGSLYVAGYLGEAEVTKGLSYLRLSASQRYRKSDGRLAKVFFGGRGLKANYEKGLAHLMLSGAKPEKISATKQRYQMTEGQIEKAKVLYQQIKQHRSEILHAGTEYSQ